MNFSFFYHKHERRHMTPKAKRLAVHFPNFWAIVINNVMRHLKCFQNKSMKQMSAIVHNHRQSGEDAKLVWLGANLCILSIFWKPNEIKYIYLSVVCVCGREVVHRERPSRSPMVIAYFLLPSLVLPLRRVSTEKWKDIWKITIMSPRRLLQLQCRKP